MFNRGNNAPSGVFVATFQDQNNKSNGNGAVQTTANGSGNPFLYIGASMVDSGNSGQFLDKPWIAVDVPRAGRTATCKINGQTISSGYVYLFYTQFNGNDKKATIYATVSKDCGKTWAKSSKLSASLKVAQGTVATIDPTTGRVYVFFRQIAAVNQPDAIYYHYSDDGGNSFVAGSSPAYTFPAGMAFDAGEQCGHLSYLQVSGGGSGWERQGMAGFLIAHHCERFARFADHDDEYTKAPRIGMDPIIWMPLRRPALGEATDTSSCRR